MFEGQMGTLDPSPHVSTQEPWLQNALASAWSRPAFSGSIQRDDVSNGRYVLSTHLAKRMALGTLIKSPLGHGGLLTKFPRRGQNE